MEVRLIRHFATEGNLEKRYIGVTDEEIKTEYVLEHTLKKEENGRYGKENGREEWKPELVIVSPLRRCRQTAELIYPEYKQRIVPDFRECDFGIFEGKNYKELSGNEQYQRWIDSNATIPFPQGEDVADFKKRSVKGWYDMIKQCRLLNYSDIACVIHGGTIMSVMSEIYGGGYYDYHCGNGDGYICDVALDGSINNYTELLRCE